MTRMSIRWRLTLWYGAVLATVLAVFGAAVYLMMRHQLRTRMDAELRRELVEIIEEVEEARDLNRLKERLGRQFAHHESYELQVTTADGEMILKSGGLGPARLPIPAVPGSLKRLDYETVPLDTRTVSLANRGRLRVAGELAPGPTSTVIVQTAASVEPDERELSELLLVLLFAGPVALACALGGGYLLARKALEPVDRMAATAGEISMTRLDRRLQVPNPDDELGRLAHTLNDMIARLERSVGEVLRFTADAAHELRTPLAVLRTEAEVALKNPRQPEEYRQVIEVMLAEVERLARLAERLLFLCREDAGLALHTREPVPFDQLLHEVTDLMAIVAREKGLDLRAAPFPPGQVTGDQDQLRRLLFNLLDNAIKFTTAGGEIVVQAGPFDGRYRVVMSDTGSGIPAEHLPHIFERFYRVDPSRSNEIGGSGLGLAISRSIAEAHRGEIRVESTPGRGTEVTIILPLTTSGIRSARSSTQANTTHNPCPNSDGQVEEKHPCRN